jgi:peptide/nickel transport system substrate-binding protein
VQVDISPSTPIYFYRKVSFFRASWIADYPDAENYLSLFYSKNFSPDGPNYTHFKMKNSIVYDQAFKETNDQKRFILYQKMDQIIIDEAPIIPFFMTRLPDSQEEVTGLGINPLNLLRKSKRIVLNRNNQIKSCFILCSISR